jgi:tetraacyldisaccharide 4'-kinase
LLAESEGLGDLFILDDGFQHRRLFRDVDLVTIDPAEWVAGESLFPYGRWREPKEAISRADAAIVQESSAPLLDCPIPTFVIQTVLDGLYRGSERVSIQAIKNHAVTAFAGIAKPDRFFRALETMGVPLNRRVRFPDHHYYSVRDLATLPGEIQITTEKDAVRLGNLGSANFLHLRISAKIPEIEKLLELIHDRLH